ncbi:MAG: PAS domain S-box protein [Ferruginibacter sp.]
MTPGEDKYFTIFNEASDSIILWNKEGRLTDVNRSLCRLLGYTREELMQMNIVALVDPDELKNDLIALAPLLNGEHILRELRLQKKDGSIVEVEVNVKRVSENLIIAIGRNITERRIAQKRIALGESNFKTAFEHSAMGMVIVSPEGKFLKVNKKFAQITGYSEQELLKKDFFDLTHFADIHEGLSIVQNAIASKLNTYVTEKRYIHKNSNIIWVNITSSVVYDEMGKALYFIAQVEDVTEKKEASEKLRASEERYRSIIDVSNTGAWEYHLDTNRVWYSPQYFAMLGLNRPDGAWDESLNTSWNERLHPDDREPSMKYFEEYLKGGSSGLYENYFRMRHENGEWIWIWSRARRLLDKDGNPTNVTQGTHIDITERKLAEAQLKSINHDIGERVKELNCLYRLSELTNAPGKTIEDILQELVQIIPPSYQYPEITTARITFKGHTFESRNFSESIWKQDATIKINNVNTGLVEIFYNRDMPELDEGPFLKEERALINSIAEILGSAAERKNAEALIKEQAETFQAIIENTKESIYLISPEYKVLQFNSTASERERITRGMEIYIGADFREFVYPDKSDLFQSQFEDALKGIYRIEEVKAKSITGDYLWFQSKTSPVYDRESKLIGVRVLTDDINERKRSEAVLQESEEKFRSIVEQSLVGIYIIQNGKLVYVNPGFEKIFGYSKNKLINKMTFEGLVHPDDIELVSNHYTNRVSKRKTSHQYIFRAVRNGGAVLHLEVIASMISFNNEPAIIGTLVDITGRIEEERKMNQAVIDAQEKERLQIGMELHDNVKQILAGSGLYLSVAQQKLDDKELVNNMLEELKKFNTLAIDELRRLSHQLAPLVESGTSLNDKIAWLISSLKLTEKLSVAVHIDDFEKPLDDDTQLSLYRILQEQLGNILRYADASTVEINIRHLNHEIYLQVKDNGKGFDINKKKEGIGLQNIRRRAQMLNGKVEIITSTGKGCEVKLVIPITSVKQVKP